MSEDVKRLPVKKNLSDPDIDKLSKKFVRHVGIVYLEDVLCKRKRQPNLNFDQDACSYFLLQMNSVQEVFEFQIIPVVFDGNYSPDQFFEDFSVPFVNYKDQKEVVRIFEDWLINLLEIIKYYTNSSHIDYWVFITSDSLPYNWYFRSNESENVWLITSDIWQRRFSPPSLFEYLSLTTFICALYSLANEFKKPHYSHYQTVGCLFDFTNIKSHRRILVSNPILCQKCSRHFEELQQKIRSKKREVDLLRDIKSILSRKWIGNLEDDTSPAHILKRVYRLDLDANSGFYKTRMEKIAEFTKDHQILTLTMTAIATILAALGIISI